MSPGVPNVRGGEEGGVAREEVPTVLHISSHQQEHSRHKPVKPRTVTIQESYRMHEVTYTVNQEIFIQGFFVYVIFIGCKF